MKRILSFVGLFLFIISTCFGQSVGQVIKGKTPSGAFVPILVDVDGKLLNSGSSGTSTNPTVVTSTGTVDVVGTFTGTLVGGVATDPIYMIATGVTYNVSSYTNFTLTPNVAYAITPITNMSMLSIALTDTSGEFWAGIGTTTVAVSTGRKVYSSILLNDMNLVNMPISIIASTALNISTIKLSR